ncbi:alpha-ketoglutarate-dependent dioxygenase AlkB [Novosphingobium aerophilum]|uniref:alpha-ketoglutarate-dependent dioxygenase AlkB n=1 Tax=Novosphingobium aerophilum TaxID=2839843 RepID=UPI00163D4695
MSDRTGGANVAQWDLFGPAPAAARAAPEGFHSWRDVISPAEENDLIARIDASQLQPFRFQGWLGKRLTRSFGWTYDFDRGYAERGPPLPAWLLPMRTRVADHAGLPPERFEQALIIRYDPGAVIGWHKDRSMFEHVAGISLGRNAPLRFRRKIGDGKFERFTHEAPRRGLYLLTDEVRHQWEHSIAELDSARWSITFRTLVGPPPIGAA